MLRNFSFFQQYICSLPARNIFHELMQRIYPDPDAGQRNVLYIYPVRKQAIEFYSNNIMSSSVETGRKFFFFQHIEQQEDCFASVVRPSA